jgi:hypothetical protein
VTGVSDSNKRFDECARERSVIGCHSLRELFRLKIAESPHGVGASCGSFYTAAARQNQIGAKCFHCAYKIDILWTAVYPARVFVEMGGLMSYGLDPVDQFHRATAYFDRILKGEKPANLPVQNPIKFELIINLKTAKALGLDLSLAFQQRADEVME